MTTTGPATFWRIAALDRLDERVSDQVSALLYMGINP
jgi:hypothetical protein